MQRFPDLPQAISSIVLSLLLAVLVWVAATSTDLQQITFPSTIPEQGIEIEVNNVPDDYMVTEVEGPDRAVVTLLIPQEQQGRLRRSDLRAYVDLSDKGAGDHQVRVQVERQEGAPPFRVISAHPDRIVVQLDEVITRTMPIDVSVSDTATIRQNYQVLTPTVDPPSVTISGPQPIVENIEEVVAEISVLDAQDTVNREVELQLNGTDGAINRENLQLTPNTAEVAVPIQQRQGYRELVVRAVVQGNPARGYWVSRIVVEPDTVTVVGQPPIVAELDGIVDTEPVDVEGLGEGEVVRRVALQLPDDVSPLDEGFVTVRVQIEPQTSSKTVTLEPEIVGLEPGLTVEPGAIVPATMDVLLQGPIIELEDINLDQIGATLDVTGKDPGTYLVEPRITTPASLRAESVIPEQVEVTITEEQGSRELTVPVMVRGLPPGMVAVMDAPTIVATVEGPVRALAKLRAHDVETIIDGNGLTRGSHLLSPEITVQDGLTVTNLLPDSVETTLVRSSEVQRLSTSVDTVNLEQGLQATLRPTTVDLRIWDTGERSASLSRNDTFSVRLDLADLGPGSHLVRPQVQLPPDSRLVDVVPRYIEVTIR